MKKVSQNHWFMCLPLETLKTHSESYRSFAGINPDMNALSLWDWGSTVYTYWITCLHCSATLRVQVRKKWKWNLRKNNIHVKYVNYDWHYLCILWMIPEQHTWHLWNWFVNSPDTIPSLTKNYINWFSKQTRWLWWRNNMCIGGKKFRLIFSAFYFEGTWHAKKT